MKQHLWFILFAIVLGFYVMREKQFAFIYYTIWTFTLELSYFGAKSFGAQDIANKIWPYLVAPAIVVCVGFWVIIAPMQFKQQPPENLVMIFVTHGMNMIAVLVEKKPIYMKQIWKPILYTTIYNLFLAIYVGGGGRSKANELPYWYAQYDQPIGWIFAALAITASGAVHFIMALPDKKQKDNQPKQYIV